MSLANVGPRLVRQVAIAAAVVCFATSMLILFLANRSANRSAKR